MSHKATNWAVQVRGIKPAAKVVLWHLADRHNKDTGRCDPSQERLADDCEMSRSSLNDQLKTLERAGLIGRTQRYNGVNKKRMNTAYILNFNVSSPQDMETNVQNSDIGAVSEKSPNLCPKKAQTYVRISDNNPVREPVNNLTRERVYSSSDEFWADTIRNAKPWAVSQVSGEQARGLIEKKLVTEQECRKAGVL